MALTEATPVFRAPREWKASADCCIRRMPSGMIRSASWLAAS